ncbi:glycosyltransferase [Komagataeibacter sp. FNDCF1]|uniref:glycosyltransferase family 2 protein n=1 Tax=Komagataeibacter sp. FNDCF1 TaxID=2878681 RepID=UPI001E3AA291|nr:glycosyltransferase [Komagataeibacter sp. FNDCF1]MCE2565389.1 glycosyltransferase [Komagataeibacter sp. FNDCF1]
MTNKRKIPRGISSPIRYFRRLARQIRSFIPAGKMERHYLDLDTRHHYHITRTAPEYCYVRSEKPDVVLPDLPAGPEFSIVVPVYNTEPRLLDAMLESVYRQWYPDWNLILVDDASSREDTVGFLQSLSHPSVHVLYLEHNTGIAEATNTAIRAATGSHVVFLDHDDELTEDCLHELALCINLHDPDYIYSDEDKIDENGRFVQPFFKPDWSPDTLMSIMYTCHVSCVRRDLLMQTGLLRSEFNGAQDWDLVLRITERAQKIFHIPKVLYHWRIIPQSIAADMAAKPYAVSAAQRLREEALHRRGHAGLVEPLPGHPVHCIRYIPEADTMISIIIVIQSHKHKAQLRQCLQAISQGNEWENTEIIIVASDRTGHIDVPSSSPCRHVSLPETICTMPAARNFGAAQAEGTVLLFLDADLELQVPDALDRMAGYAQREHIGAVGAKLLLPGGKHVQHAGILNGSGRPVFAFQGMDNREGGYFMRNLVEYNWIAVSGACLMIERAKFEMMQGFDESLARDLTEIDLCFRLVQKNYWNIVCPQAKFTYAHKPEINADIKDIMDMYNKNPEFFLHDPFYNANLRADSTRFDLAL